MSEATLDNIFLQLTALVKKDAEREKELAKLKEDVALLKQLVVDKGVRSFQFLLCRILISFLDFRGDVDSQ